MSVLRDKSLHLHAGEIVTVLGPNGASLAGALWTVIESVLSAILPPWLRQQISAIRVVMVGAILVAMLLYRPQGLLPERRNASRESRLKS